MKILWFSSLAWQKQNKYPHPLDGPGAISGSIFQQSIIEGLEDNDVSVDIINDYPIRSKKLFRGYNWSHNNKNHDIAIGKTNIPLLSVITKTFNLLKSINYKINKSNYDVAISYLIHTPYLLGLWFTKIKKPNIKTILICPDLPGFMDMSLRNKPIKRFAKKIDGIIINLLMKKIDGYVLFSEAMRNKLPINNKPFVVIEGVYSGNSLDFNEQKKERAILHAGTLHKNIGIENILEGFMLIEDDELELWIFGDGELTEYVKEQALTDSRIKYFGFVSREMLFEYEKKALLLVNARNPLDEFTVYSFPSKTFEYMVSGTPFLTTKLQGIPSEYYPYLYLMGDNKPITIKNSILKIINQSENDNTNFGTQARKFVLDNKNYLIQSRKLLDFMYEK